MSETDKEPPTCSMENREVLPQTRHGQLIAAYRVGDKGSLDVLFRELAPLIKIWLLRGGIRAEDCDDLSQDVFMHVILKLNQLDNVDAFPGWLKKIVYSLMNSFRVNVRNRPHARLKDTIGSKEDAPETRAMRSELTAATHQVLEGLRPLDREVLRSFYLQGKPLKELCNMLSRNEDSDSPKGGIPEGTVKRRLKVARGRFAYAMGGKHT